MASRIIYICVIFSALQCLESVFCVRSGLDLPLRTKRQPAAAAPLVRVEQGLLRGRREEAASATGGHFYSFRGIPYAQPPLGQLRFKDAESPLSWEGVRNATSHGNICPQPLSSRSEFVGDEDCLFLNVYTPLLPEGRRYKLPVMFWIHGGGFTTGSGNDDMFGPDYLVSENVVLVTINYRLGPLGFLYLNEAAPGNAGMKDQVAALRWVQRNIAAFGGDPAKVTIFGQSSGASSVQLLMLSPMTRGLFRAAIGQSGNAVNNWADATAREQISMLLASILGCGAGDVSAVVNCLRGVNASTIIASSSSLISRVNEILPTGFLPTLDLEVPGVSRFLPAPPIELIMNGRYHAVPFIVGFTNKESYYALRYANFYNKDVARQYDSSWNLTLLPILRLPDDSATSQKALQALRDFYMQGQPLTNETIPGFMNMLTDIAFAEGIYYSLRFMARNRKAPMYEYSFTIDDQLNFMKQFIPVSFSGAVHADDIGYIFRMNILPDVGANSSAATARARLVRLWTNFAKYRMPTLYPDLLLGTCWKPYIGSMRNYLEIGPILRSDRDLNTDRVTFWENFYHIYAQEQT